jgi:hypothetical protein
MAVGDQMARSGLRVKYEGSALDDGRMDVRDLAPALLGLADAFQEANRVLYPGASDVSLEIRATEPGSFDVVLDLAIAGTQMFVSDPVTALVNLKAAVFDPVAGLLGLLRARRRGGDETTNPDGSVTIESRGTVLSFPPAVNGMSRNVELRRSLTFTAAPLGEEGVEELVVSLTDSPNDPQPIVITQGDRGLFDPSGPSDEDLEQTEPISDHILLNTAVQVRSLTWDVGRAWRFSDGDDNVFWGHIVDEEFNARLGSGPQYPKTVFRCDLRIRVWQRPEGGLHTRRDLLKIHREIAPPSPPPQLPLGDPE